MSIESDADLLGLRAIGAIVAEALAAMARRVAPGVTTGELDAACAEVLRRRGARATPQHVYRFPAASCVSVNSEAVHGIPGKRALRTGGVVKLDVTADKDGYVADAARTVVVGNVPGSASGSRTALAPPSSRHFPRLGPAIGRATSDGPSSARCVARASASCAT